MDIYAGNSFTYSAKYKYSVEDYSATFILINANNKYTIAATVDDDKFLFEADPTVTADWGSGYYTYFVFVEIIEESIATERYKVEAGVATIHPDISAEDTFDTRTHAKKVLDAIEAVIENRATLDQQMYMIGGRQLVRNSISELLRLRTIYRQEYQAEVDKASGKNRSKIRTRFV